MRNKKKRREAEARMWTEHWHKLSQRKKQLEQWRLAWRGAVWIKADDEEA